MYMYVDRHSQDPILDKEPEIRDLVLFAKAAKIDDVMVFGLEENLNTGHITEEEQKPYLDMMASIRSALLEEGISFSVNPWASLLHKDAGAFLKPGQNFRTMVDPCGNRSKACVCPLCGEWRKYIAGTYARYAALHPAYIWIEDDFRYHNHAPLKWGGCFCEEHMRVFSERAGHELTREEFVKGILQPGEPHPYRKIWLDVCREGTLENAKIIADAVHAVSPETKVSLMSSAPGSHCAEGRDWHKLLAAIGGAHRIHLPAYSETRPASYLMNVNKVSMMIRAMTPDDTEILPEVENAMWGRYNCSNSFTRFQLYSTLPLNVRGTTLNLFDMIGAGALGEEHYQNMLAEVKPTLSDMNDTGVFALPKKGVRVLYSPDSSYTIHTVNGTEMSEIQPDEGYFAALLGASGIPFYYSDSVNVRGETVAVAGQVLRNYTKDEIERLFAENRVILNADSVLTLMDMGLGKIIGADDAEWLVTAQGGCAYERTMVPYFGKQEGRVSIAGSILSVRYSKKTENYTEIINVLHEKVGSGIARIGNALVVPFGNGSEAGILSTIRVEALRDAVRAMDPGILQVAGCPYLFAYDYEGGYTYLLNGAMDDYREITLRLPHEPEKVRVFKNGEWESAEFTWESGILRIREEIRTMTGMLLSIG